MQNVSIIATEFKVHMRISLTTILCAVFLSGLSMCIAVIVASSPAQANPRYAALIMEESSGKVLYSRNADKQLYPASLTKIMTLYMVFEALQQKKITFDTRMKVSSVAASRSPSKLYLKHGSSISVKNAILALVTKSANDVATVVSEHLGGTEREFAKQMTRKARSLGMSRTTFKNASGLPNRAQKSTARDMAVLGRAIRRDFPQYYHFFSRTSFDWNGRKFRNHNKLLSQFAGTDGIKTGYINASGFNLVAATERNGVRLIGVVFGGRTGKSRNQHMMSLLGKQFERVRPIMVKNAPLPSPPAPRPKLPQIALNLNPEPVLSPAARNTVIQPARQAISAWVIQVGSYSRRVSAHKAAIRARRLAPEILGQKAAKLSLSQKGGLALWRVRFDQLNEDQAREACATLFASVEACIAVPDDAAASS